MSAVGRCRWIGVSLLAAVAVVTAFAALVGAQTPPPASGDWVIWDSTSLSSPSIDLNGSLFIENGGSLTLTGGELRITSSFPGEHRIRVEAGGTLVLNGTHVNASNSLAPYRFQIYGAASIDGAWLEYMWGSTQIEVFGVEIYSGAVDISNSTIEHGWRGNVYIGAGSPTLRGNTIRESLYAKVSDFLSTNCFAYSKYEAVGILVANGSSPRLIDNVISNNGGDLFYDYWRSVFDKYYPGSGCTNQFFIVGYVFGRGLVVERATIEASGNVFSNNSNIPMNNDASYVVNATWVDVWYREGDVSGTPRFSAAVTLEEASGNFTDNTIETSARAGLVGDGGTIRAWGVRFVNNSGANSYAGLAGAFVARGAFRLEGASFTGDGLPIVIDTDGYVRLENLSLPPSFASTAIYATHGISHVDLFNTSFVGWTTAINVGDPGGAHWGLHNCAVLDYQIYGEEYDFIDFDVFYLVEFEARWTTGVPAFGADATLMNRTGAVIAAPSLDALGQSPAIWAGRRHIMWSGTSAPLETANQTLTLQISANGTQAAPVTFRFEGNVKFAMVIDDPYPPIVEVIAPASGAHVASRPLQVFGHVLDVGAGVASVNVSADSGATWEQAPGTGPMWFVNMTLDDGVYDLVVAALDLAGGLTIHIISGVVVDTVPPALNVSEPLLPSTPPVIAYVALSAMHIRGTAGADGVVEVNGLGYGILTGPFDVLVDLVEGPNFVRITVADAAGNTGSEEFVVISDRVRPVLFIAEPADEFSTRRTSVEVTGNTEPGVLVQIQGAAVPSPDGAFQAFVNLTVGLNLIRVNATDQAGNVQSRAVRVTYDPDPPVIVIDSPTDGASTRAGEVAVAGHVDANVDVVFVNGAPAAVTAGAFAAVATLVEGRTVILVEATDRAGNEANVSIAVYRDSVGPLVELISPLPGSIVNKTVIGVRGNVTDALYVFIDGASALEAGGSFETEVALKEGLNSIMLVARDAAGNDVLLRINITRDTKPPSIAVTTADGTIIDGASATISGSAPEAVALSINGFAVRVEADGSFRVVVPLEVGANRLEIRAWDVAGNEATLTRTVVRPAPPEASTSGFFGLGVASYALLPACIIGGALAAVWWLRRQKPA